MANSFAPVQFLRTDWNPQIWTAVDNSTDQRTSFALTVADAGVLPTDLEKFQVGCILLQKAEKQIYLNVGNDDTPDWQPFGPGTSALPTPFIAGQYLTNDGTDAFWALVDLETGVTGLLDVTNIDMDSLEAYLLADSTFIDNLTTEITNTGNIEVVADGVTITGTGTTLDPLVAVGGGGGVSTVSGTYIDNTDPSNPVSVVPLNRTASVPPTASDDSADGFAVDSKWFDSNLGILYTCEDATVGAAVWTAVGNGSGVSGIFSNSFWYKDLDVSGGGGHTVPVSFDIADDGSAVLVVTQKSGGAPAISLGVRNSLGTMTYTSFSVPGTMVAACLLNGNVLILSDGISTSELRVYDYSGTLLSTLAGLGSHPLTEFPSLCTDGSNVYLSLHKFAPNDEVQVFSVSGTTLTYVTTYTLTSNILTLSDTAKFTAKKSGSNNILCNNRVVNFVTDTTVGNLSQVYPDGIVSPVLGYTSSAGILVGTYAQWAKDSDNVSYSYQNCRFAGFPEGIASVI